MLDAVVTAGGRLAPADAKRYGTDVKAFVRVGGRSLLDIVIGALRGVPDVGRIVVVGPKDGKSNARDFDEWVDEYPTGEENLFAGLHAGRTERVIVSASDLPFVTARSYADLLARTHASIDAGYPIYRREDFLAAYPGGRTNFVKLADGRWTGGSAFVINRFSLLRNAAVLERGFRARKSPAALASLLGPVLLAKFVLGRIRVADVEARASTLLGAAIRAICGADPALAMDCDDGVELEYARAERAG